MNRVAIVAAALAALMIFAIAMIVFTIAKSARAEHNHDHHRFHAFYQNWMNKDGKSCCNDRDCKTIADSDVKEFGGALNVRIEGQWCPVLSKHYLQRGNAPNWESAHVCVQIKSLDPDAVQLTPCERLLCFQPKPLS